MILTPEQPTLALHARNASESAHPELWRGLVSAVVGALGLRDVVRKGPLLLNGPVKQQSDYIAITPDGSLASTPKIPPIDKSEPITIMHDFRVVGGRKAFDRTLEIGITNIGAFWGSVVSEIRYTLAPSHDTVPSIIGFGERVNFACTHTRASGVTKTYRDGKLIGTQTLYRNDIPGGRVHWGGELDDADDRTEIDHYAGFIYRRVLSPQEIQTLYDDPLAPFRLRDDTALATAAMFGGTPSVTIPPPLLNMQMTGSF